MRSRMVTHWVGGWLGSYGKTQFHLSLNLEGYIINPGDFLLPLMVRKVRQYLVSWDYVP